MDDERFVKHELLRDSCSGRSPSPVSSVKAWRPLSLTRGGEATRKRPAHNWRAFPYGRCAPRYLAARRPGRILEQNSDAMNPGARSRAARQCLEGSKSRNRLSGETHAAGFFALRRGSPEAPARAVSSAFTANGGGGEGGWTAAFLSKSPNSRERAIPPPGVGSIGHCPRARLMSEGGLLCRCNRVSPDLPPTRLLWRPGQAARSLAPRRFRDVCSR